MQIGTRVRYGMLAMMDLARRGKAVPARALDIARAHGLSKGYLEGLLATLRRAGLVRAVRGPGGGWVLARSPAKIRPLDIFKALEGGTTLVPCVEEMKLCRAGAKRCRARSLWAAMGRALDKVLRAQTLAALSGVARRPRASSSRKPKRKARKAAKKKVRKTVKKKAPKAVKRKTRATPPKRVKAARRKIVKAPARRRLRKSA